MYTPNPHSEFRVQVDFRVDFTNGGYLEGSSFLLDLEGREIGEAELKGLLVDAMHLARAGKVTIFRKQIVRRGENEDA